MQTERHQLFSLETRLRHAPSLSQHRGTPTIRRMPCQRLDIYFLGRPSFLLGEYNLVFFITYPLRHKTYTKPLYFHKSKRNISYSQRTQQKNQPGSSSPLSKCQSKPYEVSLFVPQTGYVPEYAILAQQRNI